MPITRWILGYLKILIKLQVRKVHLGQRVQKEVKVEEENREKTKKPEKAFTIGYEEDFQCLINILAVILEWKEREHL